MNTFKSEFSIQEIGKFQFYSGILIGIGFSFILNVLFRLFLVISNLGIFNNTWNLDYEVSNYYNLLIGFTSVAFAFCFTSYLWMSKPYATIRRKTLKLRMAQINPIWILFGTLFFLTRMFWFISEAELTLENDFPLLGFLIPIFIYLYCWNLITAIYKSKKTFLITSFTIVIIAILLSVF